MKKILLTLAVFFVTFLSMAQSPNLMNYQGVARNAAGNVLPNQSISLRLSIVSGTPTGTAVYSETRTLLTNAFGLFNVVVGSPGASNVIGTIAGINWTAFGSGSGNKYLTVELDPNGGSSFTNVGSTQLVSVPYALNAGAAAPVGPAGGDLTGTYPNPQIFFPLIKTFNATTLTPANTQLIGMTNSATTGTLGAITGTSASNDASATAIRGTISSTSPGGFSSAVSGINNGTSGLGIGVTGTQAGSGWGVYGFTPNGTGVYGNTTSGNGVVGNSTSGIGVNGWSSTGNAGNFFNTNAANTSATVAVTSNGVGEGVNSTVTGTGRAGFFQVNNAASTANALEATTNGTGASWGIRANSSGTNGAGLFVQSNAANTANNVQSNQAGLGRAGLFQNTNTANAADALLASTVTTGTTAAGLHGTAGSSGLTVALRKGTWGEADAGAGVFGTSATSVGVYGASVSSTGVVGTSINGPAGNFNLAAPNNNVALTGSTTGGGIAINAATTGTGRTFNVQNTNPANVQIAAVLNNFNSSSTSFANGTLTSTRGTGSQANTFLYTGVASSITGIAATPNGFGVQGTAETGVGVSGLTTGDPTPGNAVGVLGSAINANGTAMQAINYSTGYAFQSQGKLQLTNISEANNRILASDAVGNASWKDASAVGIVSGSGTLNFMPKWTPNGTAIGNSQLFDNGTNIGLGTTSPNGRLDIPNASTTARGLMVNNTSTTNGSSTIYAQTSNISGAGSTEAAAISAVMAPFGAGTTVSTLTSPVALKAFAAPVNTVGAAGGTAIQGSTSGGYGVAGLANDGTALLGLNLGTGYALQTQGKVQITGQGAALNRILRSDAVGNATWETLATVGAVAGTGTLNFVPKWTPDGVTIGNSSIFDDGAFVGVGTSTPTGNKLHVMQTAGSGNSAATMQINNAGNTSSVLNATTNGIGSGVAVQLTNASNGARGVDVLQTGVGPGVFATSAGGNAVWGITSSISAAGVIGDNTFGEAVVGRNRGGNGVGAVVGRNDSSGYGIRGFNTKNGIGALGQAGISGGTGIAGRFENVNAANTSNTVEVATNGIGSGISVNLSNPSNGARGVDVLQTGVGPGVFATSAGGNAVWGITSSISAAGVIGDNTFGEAVVGRNRGGNGVGAVVGRNDSSGYGIRGFNTKDGIGALGQAGISGGTGIAGRFENVNAANASVALQGATNGTGAAFLANNTNGGVTDIALFQKSSANVARIDGTGKGFFNGGTQVGGADVAEYFSVEGEKNNYEPGDVLVISQTSDRTVEKSSTPYSTLVSGVFATKPGVMLTDRNAEADQLEDMVPMGVIGVIPTKVCLEGGAIKRGDLLVTSSVSGVAMKADLNKVKPGQVIGKALQDFDATAAIGKINVLVSVK